MKDDAQSGLDRATTPKSVRLWIRLAGDFEVQLESGRFLLLVSKKARALLALVAAHLPLPVRRDAASSLLWSTKPRNHAADSLRHALRELQVALLVCGEPPILLAKSGRLTLRTESVWVDIHMAHKGSSGPRRLCQDLCGLDPAFDQHLDRLWKGLVFSQAFVPGPEWDAAIHPTRSESPAPRPKLERMKSDPAALLEGVEPIRSAPKVEDKVHGLGRRIAVLPFRSLGAPFGRGLALEIAEEISAALTRSCMTTGVTMPRIIATTLSGDGFGPSPVLFANSLAENLDYLISGTVQTAGKRMRVVVTLLDVGRGSEVIWISRFEGTTDDLSALQDTVVSETVLRARQAIRDHEILWDERRDA